MTITSHAAVALLVGAVAFTGGWKVQGWRNDARELERAQAQAEAFRKNERTADSASAGHEQDKTHEAARIRTIRTTVEKIVDRPVYRNICFDDDGLRALTSAIQPGASQPDHALP